MKMETIKTYLAGGWGYLQDGWAWFMDQKRTVKIAIGVAFGIGLFFGWLLG